MKSYIGADLGGTKLLLGELDEAGRILRTARYPSGPLSQREALDLLQNALDKFLATRTPGYEPAAVGLGLIGRIDGKTGVWHEIDRDRGESLALGQLLGERCGLPCFLDNDVRSATKAELRFGEGRLTRDFVYLNIGTGIAAGFVSGGRMITGGHCNAGEVGHTSSGLSLGVPCPCGRSDCAEAIASGSGIDRCARLLRRRFPDSALRVPESGRVSAGEVFRLSGEDALCHALTENAATAIANLIMNLVRFSDPDTVVLGGGVVADGFLFPRILEKLNAHTVRFVTRGIRLTSLDPAAIGLLGACSNAILGMEETA